jgi:exodeoxyribonuclease VII large subunit
MEIILTVTELTNSIKKLVEENFRFVYVTGEVSNCRLQQPSGHIYCTIKDENCSVKCVMWSSRAKDLIFKMEDGLSVTIKGRITLYPSRGEYQLEAWEIKAAGIGELQLKYEQLKNRLMEEGLFDEANKKPIPLYPEHVAIITSRSGAVFHDFVKIIRRRFPVITIYLFQAAVQGNAAAGNCISAFKLIEKFSKDNPIDVIVIARGGGSFEDLFCFNDEKLAREIYNSKIPVISAIGHEVDYTICDFVADKRAPTPSAAAEILTPDINELIEKLNDFLYFCKGKLDQKIKLLYNSVKEVESNYYFNRPKDLVYNFYQRLDESDKIPG